MTAQPWVKRDSYESKSLLKAMVGAALTRYRHLVSSYIDAARDEIEHKEEQRGGDHLERRSSVKKRVKTKKR